MRSDLSLKLETVFVAFSVEMSRRKSFTEFPLANTLIAQGNHPSLFPSRGDVTAGKLLSGEESHAR